MPIRFQPLVTGHYYHIYNRGVNRQPIFFDKRDYKRAINLLRFNNYIDRPTRFSKFLLLSQNQRMDIWNHLVGTKTYTDILSYCLIPNHFHLLLKQNEENGVSEFLKDFQIAYTKYINTKNDRVGPLLQGQFKARLIETDKQLLQVSRYIHLNPYSATLVQNLPNLLKYKWSSLPEYLNIEKVKICNRKLINSCYKNVDEFKKFIFDEADYLKEINRIKHLKLE
jgi:putative transposase